MENQKQSFLNWRDSETISQLTPQTQYQGVITYIANQDTTYFMTPQYYSYAVACKVCDYYIKMEGDPLDGWSKVSYEILTDCPACEKD